MSMQLNKKQNDATKARRKKFQTIVDPDDKSLTVQSESANCCINKIMAGYSQHGQINHMNENMGRYIDVTTVGDFQTALNTVAEGQQMFEELPSKIRNEMDNDPAKFLAFMDDEKNLEKMYDLGLAIRPVIENPDRVDPDAPTTTETAPETKS